MTFTSDGCVVALKFMMRFLRCHSQRNYIVSMMILIRTMVN